jgi:hypothetical protein
MLLNRRDSRDSGGVPPGYRELTKKESAMRQRAANSGEHTLGRVVSATIFWGALALGALGALAPCAPASAQIGVAVDIGVPPPPPRYEPVPVVPVGYVWAPGYWEWVHGTHVWRRGHLVEARPGYRWAPDHWEERGGQHHFEPGRLERDPDYHGRR